MDEVIQEELFMKLLGKYEGTEEHEYYKTLKFSVSPGVQTDDLKPMDYVLNITAPHKKRSTEQNSMLWELIGQICEVVNGSRNPDDEQIIYRQIIQLSGVGSAQYLAVPEAAEYLTRVYRVVIPMTYEWHDGQQMIRYWCAIGTSQMDTREMNKVIDKALEYAETVGIDTDAWKEEIWQTSISKK